MIPNLRAYDEEMESVRKFLSHRDPLTFVWWDRAKMNLAVFPIPGNGDCLFSVIGILKECRMQQHEERKENANKVQYSVINMKIV